MRSALKGRPLGLVTAFFELNVPVQLVRGDDGAEVHVEKGKPY